MKVAWFVIVLLCIFAAPGSGEDARSKELVVYDCVSELSHREVTLFANGTVRVREGEAGAEALKLAELNPEETRAFRTRLSQEDLTESQSVGSSVTGAWIDSCSLTLEVGRENTTFRFGRFDSLDLGLSRVLMIVEELGRLGDSRAPVSRLPHDYLPSRGDLLLRIDGTIYEVMGPTGDRQGLELVGRDQPITIFIQLSSLTEEFVALVERRRGR